jgi:hypothetical protein
LTGPQGTHGEDVKEYWWYLDRLPSHAWLRWRYHYPQAAYPYQRLVEHHRSWDEPELELLDTGVFDEGRYFSVDVIYAKASPAEVLARITVHDHGPDEASISVLPTCGSATPGGSPAPSRPPCSWTATARIGDCRPASAAGRLPAGRGPGGAARVVLRQRNQQPAGVRSPRFRRTASTTGW